MALTAQKIKATEDYKSGKISVDEYKEIYLSNKEKEVASIDKPTQTASTPKVEKDDRVSNLKQGYSDYVDGIPTMNNGQLTAYGRSLQSQREAQQIGASYKPSEGYDSNKGMYGGQTPTYEAYAYNAYTMGNQAMSRDAWENYLSQSNQREYKDRTDNISTPMGTTNQTPQAQLATAQKSAAQLKLEKAYNDYIANLKAQEAKIPEQYSTARTGAKTATALDAKRFEDMLAEKGILQSGTTSQGDISRNIALQGNLGALDRQETQALTDIETARTNKGIDYGLDLATLQAQETEADRQAQLEQDRYNQSLALQRENTAYNREQDAYNRQQDTLNYQTQQQELQRQQEQEQLKQDQYAFETTIAANYNDLSALRDNLIAQGAPQWQIEMAQAAVNQKKSDLNLDQFGNPLPVDNTAQIWDAAYKKWNSGIPLTQQEMQVIGATTPTKPKASSGGGTVGGNTTQPVTPKETLSFLEMSLRGTSGPTTADKMVQLDQEGYFDNLTVSEIQSLMKKFAVTDIMISQAENRLLPITLPTGRQIQLP